MAQKAPQGSASLPRWLREAIYEQAKLNADQRRDAEQAVKQPPKKKKR